MIGQHDLKNFVHFSWCVNDTQHQPSNALETRILVWALSIDKLDGIKVTTLQNKVVKVMFTFIVNLRVIEFTPVLLLFRITCHVGPERGCHVGQGVSLAFNIDEAIL